MGRYVRVTCDICSKDVYGKEYYTLPITRVRNGKQTKMPTIWVCRECMLKTHILFASPLQEKVDSPTDEEGV